MSISLIEKDGGKSVFSDHNLKFMKIDLVKQRRGIKLHVENLFRTGAEILTRVPNRRISNEEKEHQSIVRVKQIVVNDLKALFCELGLTVCVCLHSVRPNLRRLAMASSTVFTHILGDVPSSPLYGKWRDQFMWYILHDQKVRNNFLHNNTHLSSAETFKLLDRDVRNTITARRNKRNFNNLMALWIR
ncbi:hypothetical protein Bca4012_031035 [Brassica carinata]